MDKIRYYKSKTVAIKKKTTEILANRQLTDYFLIKDYHAFLDIIKKASNKNFYEYISANDKVCMFYDIEIYKDQSIYFDNYTPIITMCIDSIKNLFGDTFNIKKIILESHSQEKRSFHIILRIKNSEGIEVLFDSVKELKDLYKRFNFDKVKDNNGKHIIDPSIYREGLFRTIYSSKKNEERYMQISSLSDDFKEVESFVCYKNENYIIHSVSPEYSGVIIEEITDVSSIQENVVNNPEDLENNDILTIKKFIQKEFHHFPHRIRDVFVDKEHNCIIIALVERYCPFVDREHRSNNQYVVIDTYSAKQKCHNTECNNEKYAEIKLEEYPKEINEIIKKCLKVNQQELDLIDHAIIECKKYIYENFDEDVKDVSFDKKEMIFRGHVENRNLAQIIKGKCPECNVEHHISDNGYCLRCSICKTVFPKNQIIPLDDRYKTLNSFWMNYNQLVNHGTINNIINIYNNNEEDFSCDIKLDNSIFKNKDVTNIVNQVLDGHKVTMISRLLNNINKNFMYSKNNWYYFGGSIWKSDSDNIEMKKEIIDLSKLFDRIKTHYENKNIPKMSVSEETTMTLNKNIKSLINKFHKPGFQDDIIKGAKIYYNDESFLTLLNSKKHLVPFTNGVYDLIENKFRVTKKEDYINLTVNYNYNQDIENREVYTFLEQVLPNENVRDYVLKKMSECLNGDIPNTYFLMFIGDSGANGKSQLLNLMKLTMGDFGEKVEVTLLTRKRNNANEANTEKVKLMHKRFAFLSEPEDGEKINIGLLKELTGSEEIVARGLYQDSLSFVMEAKLFLACNELPEIKGEDTALWRRIRVIDFPSRFVDEPKESNEYKIDRTLPSRMREDITWRQTFMKILLSYYNKHVLEPFEVQVKTNEYRQENNDFYNWLIENIEYSENDLLKLKDIVDLFVGKPVKKEREKSKYKKEIENFIKTNFKTIKHEYGKVRYNSEETNDDSQTSTGYGWKHLKIRNS
jgi:P4 family phage/plasmid primase-like protien